MSLWFFAIWSAIKKCSSCRCANFVVMFAYFRKLAAFQNVKKECWKILQFLEMLFSGKSEFSDNEKKWFCDSHVERLVGGSSCATNCLQKEHRRKRIPQGIRPPGCKSPRPPVLLLAFKQRQCLAAWQLSHGATLKDPPSRIYMFDFSVYFYFIYSFLQCWQCIEKNLKRNWYTILNDLIAVGVWVQVSVPTNPLSMLQEEQRCNPDHACTSVCQSKFQRVFEQNSEVA